MPHGDIMSISKDIFTKCKNLLIEKLECNLNVHKLKKAHKLYSIHIVGNIVIIKANNIQLHLLIWMNFTTLSKDAKMFKVSYQL